MPETIRFEPVPKPRPLEVGDTVTVIEPSGVTEFRVAHVVPYEDEFGSPSQKVTLRLATP